MNDAIDWRETPEGVLLPVKAQPRARKNGIQGIHAGRLKVAVTAPAEKGKANRKILDVLAEALNVKKSHLQLVQGTTASEKLILVQGITGAELATRLDSLQT